MKTAAVLSFLVVLVQLSDSYLRYLSFRSQTEPPARRALWRRLGALGAAACAERGDFTFEDQTELFRMYSAEIEYSEENLETLYELLWLAANEQK